MLFFKSTNFFVDMDAPEFRRWLKFTIVALESLHVLILSPNLVNMPRKKRGCGCADDNLPIFMLRFKSLKNINHFHNKQKHGQSGVPENSD